VQTRDDVSRLAWGDGERVSFVIDPAMPASAAMPVLAALRARFPRIRGHHLDVMCDHATDQAHAMASVAADSELMLIITDSGEDADAADAGTVDVEAMAAVRAVQGADARVHVVRRLADIGPDLLADATSVGLAATLGAPPGLAEQVTGALSGLGPVTVSSRSVRTRRESPLGSGPVPAGELTRA
jgi:4-hydroxy-3-methylbut-2-enyl diphosphate reductase